MPFEPLRIGLPNHLVLGDRFLALTIPTSNPKRGRGPPRTRLDVNPFINPAMIHQRLAVQFKNVSFATRLPKAVGKLGTLLMNNWESIQGEPAWDSLRPSPSQSPGSAPFYAMPQQLSGCLRAHILSQKLISRTDRVIYRPEVKGKSVWTKM